MTYRVMLWDKDVGWRRYSVPIKSMGEAYTVMRRYEKRLPHRQFKVINVINEAVEAWAGREAGDERD